MLFIHGFLFISENRKKILLPRNFEWKWNSFETTDDDHVWKINTETYLFFDSVIDFYNKTGRKLASKRFVRYWRVTNTILILNVTAFFLDPRITVYFEGSLSSYYEKVAFILGVSTIAAKFLEPDVSNIYPNLSIEPETIEQKKSIVKSSSSTSIESLK